MNDEQMTQDTQTPQLPQWKSTNLSGGPWYQLVMPNGEIVKRLYHSQTLAELNAQQQRIQSAEKAVEMHSALLTDALDDVLQWRRIADTAQARIEALEAALWELYWSVATSDGKPLGIAPSQHHLDKARAALLSPAEAK